MKNYVITEQNRVKFISQKVINFKFGFQANPSITMTKELKALYYIGESCCRLLSCFTKI